MHISLGVSAKNGGIPFLANTIALPVTLAIFLGLVPHLVTFNVGGIAFRELSII